MSIIDIIDRPLVFFDLETTGVDTSNDRIVQFGAARFEPGAMDQGIAKQSSFLVNPGMPIPAAVTMVHGITDHDVSGSPLFIDCIERIDEIFDDADLAGYNIMGFDIPMLQAEYRRCWREFGLSGRRIIDAMEIYHRHEPRNLAAAVRLYAGYDHSDAHDALADVSATIDVLEGQMERYEDIPHDVGALAQWCMGDRVTLDGKIIWEGEDACINFGKHRGLPLWRTPRDYLQWAARQDMSEETRRIFVEAISRRYPKRES